MIVFLNSKRMSARALRAARLFNTGSDGHAKHGEKTGSVGRRDEWVTDEEWEAQKRYKVEIKTILDRIEARKKKRKKTRRGY